METKAKRTLVKSAPELWELADDLERMEAWMADVVGAADPVGVEVTQRRRGELLAWRTADGTPEGRMTLELRESGWGTAVRITALHPDGDTDDAPLERLLDELGAPERRPFTQG